MTGTPMTAKPPLIEIRGLSVHRQNICILNDINLDV
jgi:hypothetical protein